MKTHHVVSGDASLLVVMVVPLCLLISSVDKGEGSDVVALIGVSRGQSASELLISLFA